MFVEKGQRHEAHLSLADPLPLPDLSEGAREYRDVLRAHFLRDAGGSKEAVAAQLQRAAGWVTRWWQIAPESLPCPRDIPTYVADYELRMLKAGIEPFRGPELRRGYVEDAGGLYEECVQAMPWRQAVFRKRNYETGEVTVTNIASNRQDCSYRGLKTGIPRLDAALERLRQDFNVKDPKAYLLNNWYPDGKTSIAPHNHDFWSAILSFGEPRVFMLDGQPVLLGNGDLLVFGTQRHSVPKMPGVAEGRVSVAVFWYPEEYLDNSEDLDDDACAGCGTLAEILQESMDGRMYCEACWASWNAQAVQTEGSAVEDDMLAAALELSLVEQ